VHGDWPLVGRAAQLERVGALLRGGADGVVLAGAAGVGKTRLAAECLTVASAAGFVPLRAAATQAAARLPLGAFAPLLPDLVAGVDRAEVLRHVARAIAERGDDRPVALFVDDVHLLDEASAALTHQLARHPGLFLLATLRSGEPARDAVTALWKDGLTDRLDLGPLSEQEVDELLVSVLGGPLEGGTRHRLWTGSAGNVLLLRELVQAALEAGTLREEGGLWELRGHLPASVRLFEIVDTRLTGLAAEEREALEILALGQPLGVELMEQLTDRDLAGLERRSLIRSEQDGRRLLLRLAHPLYGETLRARLTPLRTRALSRTLADAVADGRSRRRDDVLRLATWRLDGGGSVDGGVLLAGARRARMLFDFELGERLARAAVDADPATALDAELLVAELLFVQARYDEANRILARLAATVAGGDEADRARVALMRIDSLAFGGRAEEAMVALLEAEADITDPYWRDQLAVERAMFALVGGFSDVAAELVEPLLDRVTGPALVTACIVAGQAFGLQGRLAAALAATERGLAAHAGQGVTHLAWYPAMTVMTSARDLIWAGELDRAAEISRRGYEEALALGAVEPRSWFAGSLCQELLVRGDVTAATRWGQECATLLRPLGRRIYYRVALQQLVAARAMAGDADGAEWLLKELEDSSVPLFRWEEGEVERARGWIALARGNTSGALARFRTAAAIAAASGDRVIESAALHDIARLGPAAEVAPRLTELAAVVEGPLAPARAVHARAKAARHPQGLEEAAAAFEAMGALLLAAEAEGDAAVAWQQRGEPRKATAAERRATTLAAGCDGAHTPGLADSAPARAVLTARELEIARLAGAGVANKEIAARLGLSLHTVQNKLHAAYEKLGVAGRADLARVLERH
jgi:DNA-binding CsgD family transcriptional regulator